MIDPSRDANPSAKVIPERVSSATPAPTQIEKETVVSQNRADRSLDQWRGLALLLVLFSHGFWETGRVPGVGRVGVNLFFFISGILVYRSLTKGPQEKIAAMKYFWWRRVKRLLPALYFYVGCILVFVWVAGPPLVTQAFRDSVTASVPSALLYYQNYYIAPEFQTNQKLLGHLWSIACEMQFYLVAPLIYLAGGKSKIQKTVVYGLVLGFLMFKGLSVVGKQEFVRYAFQVATWPMMAGFFAQFLITTFPTTCARLGKALTAVGALAVLLFVIALFFVQVPYEKHIKIVVLAGTPLLAGCLGCYLQGIAPAGRVGNILHYLGNRTYSIYLWQEPLTIGGLVPAFLHPLGSLLSIPVGALSFRFLELPFMSKYVKKPATRQ